MIPKEKLLFGEAEFRGVIQPLPTEYQSNLQFLKEWYKTEREEERVKVEWAKFFESIKDFPMTDILNMVVQNNDTFG